MSDQGFLRHWLACNNAVLPGDHVPVLIGADQVGWITPARLALLVGLPGFESIAGRVRLIPERLDALAAGMAGRGLIGLRYELFDVRAEPDGAVLGRLDRGALPAFGIAADGVHLNGLVMRAGELFLWVARRSASRLIDPGKLDHLAAGGVPAGLTPWQCLLKEAEEEAGLPPDLTARARHVATIRYNMQRPEGLRRDRLLVFDLDVPEDFVPSPGDGEMQGFELWPAARVMHTVQYTNDFKFNVNVVLVDLFNRFRLVEPPIAMTSEGAP
jgi:8-oxo-dGTP pyrophosphatase MutT (NUDIX family)